MSEDIHALLEEVIPFLTDQRAEVLKMAMEAVAGFTARPEVRAKMADKRILSPLVRNATQR
jgi:hypothetical protein